MFDLGSSKCETVGRYMISSFLFDFGLQVSATVSELTRKMVNSVLLQMLILYGNFLKSALNNTALPNTVSPL